MMIGFEKQKGSIHVIITVAIVVVVLVALGYVAWNHFMKKPVVKATAQTTTHPVVRTPKSGIVVLPAGDLNKYVNYEGGFEFQFPKQVYAPNECKGTDVKFDNYGNKVSSDYHYGVSDGATSMTVLVNTDEYIIVPNKTVVLSSPEGSDADGYIYTACDVYPTTLDLVNQSYKDNYGVKNISLEERSFIIRKANGADGALDAARTIFDDATGTVKWAADPEENDRQTGSFLYTPNTHLTGGFAYKLWYYPAEKKVVFFAIGQSVFFQYPDGSNQFYNPVDTFKFI